MIVFKEKLPASIVTNLLDHPGVVSYDNIMRFCKRNTDHRKEHDLRDQAKTRILSRTRGHAMPVVDQQPEIDALGVPPEAVVDKSSARDWRYEQVCAGDVQAMIDSHLKAINQNGQRGRSPSPRGGRVARNPRKPSPRAPRERFAWDGSCWHCKSKDHTRDTCNVYKRLCDANGGKAPDGYVSAYMKAKKTWEAKHKVTKDKKTTHLKVLKKEFGNHTEDGIDSGTEDESGMTMIKQSSRSKAGKSVAAPASASPPIVLPLLQMETTQTMAH